MTEDEFNEAVDDLEASIKAKAKQCRFLLGYAIAKRDNATGERKTEWRGVTTRLDKAGKALHKALRAVTSIE